MPGPGIFFYLIREYRLDIDGLVDHRLHDKSVPRRSLGAGGPLAQRRQQHFFRLTEIADRSANPDDRTTINPQRRYTRKRQFHLNSPLTPQQLVPFVDGYNLQRSEDFRVPLLR